MDLFDPFPAIKTNRLLLRETLVTDAWEVLFLRSDPSMLAYLKKPAMKDLEEAHVHIMKLHVNRRNALSLDWCITCPPVSRMIGSICLWNFSADRKKAEVGYLLHPRHRKQGIMAEALKAVMNYGFNELKLTRIEAYTHRDNDASLGLLKRHGFGLTNRIDPDNADNAVLAVSPASCLS